MDPMRFFAIETSIRRLKAQFLNDTEQEVFTVYKHPFQFLRIAIPVLLAFFAFLIVIGALATTDLSIEFLTFLLLIAAAIALVTIIHAYLDWRYDFLLFTTDKMVVVDSALFHQRVEPVNLEHLSSVSGETKFGNILGFGTLEFQMKDEFARQKMYADYIPGVSVVAAKIADIVTDFQRRKMNVIPILPENRQVEQVSRTVDELQQQTAEQQLGVRPSAQQPAAPVPESDGTSAAARQTYNPFLYE